MRKVNPIGYRLLLLILGYLGLGSIYSAQATDQDSIPLYPHPDSLRAHHILEKEPEIFVRNYRLWAEASGDLEKASDYWATAMRISIQEADSFDLLPLKGLRARALMEVGQYSAATQIFLEGIRAISSIKAGPDQTGWFYLGFGNLLFRVTLYEDASHYFRQALVYFGRAQSKEGLSVAQNNIGLAYLKQGQPDSALYHFQKGYKTRKTLSPFLQAHSTLYLTEAHLALGNFKTADSLLKRAETSVRESTRQEFKKDVYLVWAKLDLKRKQPEAAKRHLQMAAADNAGIFDEYYNLEILELYGETYLTLGKIDSALYYFEQGKRLSANLFHRYREQEFLQSLAQVYHQTGRLDQENEMLKERLDLMEEHLSEQTKIWSVLLHAEEEVQQEKREYALLEHRYVEQDNLISYQKGLLVLSLVILVILFLGAFSLYKLNQKLLRAKDKLRDIGQRTLLTGNQLDIVLLSLNQHGHIEYYNLAAKEHFKTHHGMSLSPGLHFANAFKDEDSRNLWQSRLEQAQQIDQWQEMQAYENTEQHKYFQHHFTRVKQQGKFRGLVVLIHDLTDTVLQNRVLAKKTHELKQTLAANKRMISLLAHDLKEGVISSLELTTYTKGLEEKMPEKETYENLSMIERSLSKTKSLLLKTLNWVQRAEKSPGQNLRSFHLSKLVDDVIHGQKERLEAKAINLETNIDPELRIKSDPEVVSTVLRNLLSNAIKFSQHKPIEIFVKDQGKSVEIHVKDHGTGIDEKLIDKVVQGKPIASTKGTNGEEGTGIGLTLCQEMLTLHNSFLQVHSKKDQGADFYFIIEKD